MKTQHNVDLPSGRIRFALEALEEFEARPNCKVAMSTYFSVSDKTCFACLGGIANLTRHGAFENLNPRSLWFTKDLDRKRSSARGEFGSFACSEFEAFESSLDEFRSGSVENGLSLMQKVLPPSIPPLVPITSHFVNAERFKAEMEELAARLAEEGL